MFVVVDFGMRLLQDKVEADASGLWVLEEMCESVRPRQRRTGGWRSGMGCHVRGTIAGNLLI